MQTERTFLVREGTFLAMIPPCAGEFCPFLNNLYKE